MFRLFTYVALALSMLNGFCASAQDDEIVTTEAEVRPVMVDYAALEEILNDRSTDFQVVNFWATWCKPCVEEMPYFKRLHEEIKGENGEVILVSLDFPNQLDSKLIPYIKKENLQPEVIVLNDPKANSWIDKVSESWSGAIPATVMIFGENRLFHEGKYADYNQLEKQVQSLIK